MSGRIGVADLRGKLASVLDAAGNGSVFLITRTGRDLAVLGPATGGVSELSREADDCARALRNAESLRDAHAAEVIRLRARVSGLEDELNRARELNAALKSRRFGR